MSTELSPRSYKFRVANWPRKISGKSSNRYAVRDPGVDSQDDKSPVGVGNGAGDHAVCQKSHLREFAVHDHVAVDLSPTTVTRRWNPLNQNGGVIDDSDCGCWRVWN